MGKSKKIQLEQLIKKQHSSTGIISKQRI